MVEDKLRKYMACIRCEEVPMNKSVYTCSEGHSICSTCNKRNNHKCVCGSQLMRCYTENVLGNRFKQIHEPHLSVTPIQSQTSRTSWYQLQRRSSNILPKLINSKHQLHEPPLRNISMRPMECPISDCNKLITLSSLMLHFSFDHPKIVQQYLRLDESKVLQLSLPELRYGKSVCLALLLLNMHKDSELSIPPHSSEIALPILASRILCKAESNERHAKEMHTSEHNRYTKLEKSYTDFDMFIVWICGNTDQLNCLIETGNIKKGLSYCYTGPVSSIRDLNDPGSVFLRSDCLILHSSSLDKVSFKECEGGKSLCEIRIIISKRSGIII